MTTAQRHNGRPAHAALRPVDPASTTTPGEYVPSAARRGVASAHCLLGSLAVASLHPARRVPLFVFVRLQSRASDALLLKTMAELAGIIESVKGAATIGVRLARTLYHAGHTAAPDDRIHAVAADVSFFALHLEQVAALLANPRSPHSPSALDSLTLVLNYAGALFQHFTTLVIHARDRAEAPAADASLGANGRRRRHSVAVRAKACFDEPFVAVLAAQLRHLTATVLTFIKTIQLASAVQGHAAPADLDLERSHLETLIVAQWLSINAMKDAHDLFESSRAPSTRTLPEIERATLQRHPALLSNLFAERIEPIWLCDASEDLLKRTFGTPKDDALALDQQPDNSIQLVDDILCKWTLVFDPNRSSDAPLESSAGTFAPDAASNAPQHVAEPGILSIPSIEEPRRRLETNEELGREGVESLSISAPRDVVYQSRGKASELHQPIPGRYGSNYRRPHVSSGSDSDEASDSDGAEPLSSKAERSQISSHGHHDSVIDEGLGIPWRLRISQTEYYDFRDEKLVGPRTPFLPREPRHWIYNHNNVTTEISQRWVSKDSIAEKQFTHVEIRPTAPGDEESWRIMRPLRFVSSSPAFC